MAACQQARAAPQIPGPHLNPSHKHLGEISVLFSEKPSALVNVEQTLMTINMALHMS